MDETRRCTQCGGTNLPDSRFCERCGAPIRDAARYPSLQSSGPLTSPQPPAKRLNQRYVIYAVVGVLVVATFSSTGYFLGQLSRYDYSSQITSYYQHKGFSVVKPFTRTVSFGADAYVGSGVGELTNGAIAVITVFPRSTDYDALSFEQTLVPQFESQGFIEANSSTGWWVGTSNSSVVGIQTYTYESQESPTGLPAVVILQFAEPSASSTSSVQRLTASRSAPAEEPSSKTTTAKLASDVQHESNADRWLLTGVPVERGSDLNVYIELSSPSEGKNICGATYYAIDRPAGGE